MKHIYMDMMIADANVENNPDMHLSVDTMAVYQAIFDKYGITVEDFLESHRIMLSDPEKFGKMAKDWKEEFEKRNNVAQREIDVRDSLANIEYERQLAIQTEIDNFLDSIGFAHLLDTVDVCRLSDSTVVTISGDDSTRFVTANPVDTVKTAKKVRRGRK